MAPLAGASNCATSGSATATTSPGCCAASTCTSRRAEAVGLVGLNGAGKSTIVKLLCRLLRPDRGAILWDGVDLRDLDVTELRRRIGAVFQDYMAYDLTRRGEHRVGDLRGRRTGTALIRRGRQAGVHGRSSHCRTATTPC